MSETAAKQQSRPTLLIGLGGTGKQVLLNLRRMFYDRHGVFTLPHIGHLWIDTDTRSKGIDGEDLDFLLKEVDFEEREKIGTALDRSDLANYYDHASDFPHIFSWFDINLRKHGEIKDGASQIRSFGRLAFFHHHRDVRRKVRDQVDRILNVDAQNRAAADHGIDVNLSSWDAWIIFSVAGGTGSGMFLDLAFSLRKEYRNLNVSGMLVLPSIFTSDMEHRVYANAYAALVELEHYNYAKDDQDTEKTQSAHLFHPQWTKELDESPDAGLRGPVFDTCYVLGNRPRSSGGVVDIDDKNAYCEMLAEHLYIEYGGGTESLASALRSERSNFANALRNNVSWGYEIDGTRFGETYSVNYSSFGLSKLFIPIDRVYTRCRHRLALDLIEHWVRPTEPPRSLDKTITEQIMPRLKLADDERRRDLVSALDWGGERGEKLTAQVRKLTFEKGLELARDAGRDDIDEILADWYRKEMLGGLLHRSDSTPVERWGGIATTVRSNADVHLKEVRQALDDEIRTLVDQPEARFGTAREVLRRVADRLGQQRERCLEQETRSRGGGARLDDEITRRLGWLQDGYGEFTRRTIVNVAVELVERRLVSELRAQVFGEAARLLQRVIDYIGRGETTKDAQGNDIQVETGLLRQLTDLRQGLDVELRKRLKARLDAFSKPVSSLINQNLYEEGDFGRVYNTEREEPIDQAFLTECERHFYEAHAPRGITGLWDLRKVIGEQGYDHLLRLLLEFARERTAYMEIRSADVIRRLSERYEPDSGQYNAALTRLLDFSQPWLAAPEHFVPPDLVAHTVQKQWVARFDAPNSEYNSRFEAALGRLSPERISFAGSTPDRVYACSEIAGFPLSSVPQIDAYRDRAYLPLLKKGGIPHADLAFERFQDLMPKTEEQLRRHVRALKTLIQAILIRVVDCDDDATGRDGRAVVYHYTSTQNLFPTRNELGSFALAVRRLADPRNAEQLEEIERVTHAAIDDLREEAHVRWVALLYYYEGQLPQSPNRQLPESHPTRAAARQLALERLGRDPDLAELVTKQLKRIAEWSEERPRGSGMRVLRAE